MAPAGHDSNSNAPLERLRVLVVDDSSTLAQIVASTLSKEPDIEVRTCTESMRALDVALEFRPTVILQDMVMPGIDGLELIRSYRRQQSLENVPIIVHSSEDTAAIRTAAFQVGADDYVLKDAEHVELLARVRYHGRRYQSLAREGLLRHLAARNAASHTVRVLTVEPSKIGQTILSAAFRRERDLVAHFVKDDRSALQMVDELLPTVVVVSLFGGDYDAFDLIARLRARRATSDVPILLFTSTNDPGLKARAFSSGANDYVMKMNDMSDLVARVRRHSSHYFAHRLTRLAKVASQPAEDRVRVLMVDDSVVYARNIQNLLRNERGLSLTTMSDPLAAIDTIRKEHPHVVLLDLDMPEMSGLEVLRILRDDPATRELPVIVFSGETDPMTKARAFSMGADDYIDKLVDKVELASRLHHHAQAHMAALERRAALEAAMDMQRRVEVKSDFIRRTFGRYVSDGVADAILTDPEGLQLGGEARVVTLMMTDLRGFTSMCERLPPDEVIVLLNAYFDVMTRVLMRYEATIDEFIGDAILAIFGAPNEMFDHAERAVACAIAMQNAMAEVNAKLAERSLPPLEMGIGLNTGEVVVGNVGSERRTKYGVIGRHVNLVSRIESFTTGGQILAADSTVVGTRGLAKTRSSRVVEPKGIRGRVLIHEVFGIGGEHATELEHALMPVSELVEPLVPVSLHATAFDGKAKTQTMTVGRLLRVGTRSALMATDGACERDANLQITLVSPGGGHLAEEVFAKVMGPGPVEGTYELHFTSLSPEARAVIASITPSPPTSKSPGVALPSDEITHENVGAGEGSE
jgi:adenylate cyclase